MEFLGGVACTEVKEIMQQDEQQSESVAEKIKTELERIHLQRHKSVEVGIKNKNLEMNGKLYYFHFRKFSDMMVWVIVSRINKLSCITTLATL